MKFLIPLLLTVGIAGCSQPATPRLPPTAPVRIPQDHTQDANKHMALCHTALRDDDGEYVAADPYCVGVAIALAQERLEERP
jgi:hypothetical protein